MKIKKAFQRELKRAERRNLDKWMAVTTAIADYATDAATPKDEAEMWLNVLRRLRDRLAAEDAEQPPFPKFLNNQ